MNQHTYCLITSSVVVELSLAQFDYIQCAESGLAPHSGFEPWPQDVKLACTSALTTQPNWTFKIKKYNLTRSFIWYLCLAFRKTLKTQCHLWSVRVNIGKSICIAVGRCTGSGSQLATMLVNRYFYRSIPLLQNLLSRPCWPS